MKRILSVIICLLLCSMVFPAFAAGEAPQIILQPQNYQYPEYGTAIYTVKATGTNLSATWYLEYEGKTYNISDITNGIEPWEGYAGETYGPNTPEAGVFTYFFGGIGAELSGAEIWCVIEDGHYDVPSAHAIITVQGENAPPEILQLPARLDVSQGAEAELRCVARSVDETQLSFQWYETTTGKLQDIRAIDGEENDFIFCSTEKPGTRYFVCCVSSTAGGTAYSSVIPVTVAQTPQETPGKLPQFVTQSLPQGTVGEPYSFQLQADDPQARFDLAHDPQGSNDFEKTGLKIDRQGLITGTPTAAGSFTFLLCTVNAEGERYLSFTLTVTEPAATTPETTDTAAPESAPPATQPTQPPVADQTPGAFPWWGILLIALGGIGIGIGTAIVIMKTNKKA